MRRVNAEHIEKASQFLGEAALDPAMWPAVMDKICEAAGAIGGFLLQTDVEANGQDPFTPALTETAARYFGDGWYLRDSRATRGIPLLLRGEIITDQDLFTPDELRRDSLYNECIYGTGLAWFAAVGFSAGSAFWALSIQRTAQDGPFEPQDKAVLATMSRRLTETATLSTAVGRSVIAGMTDALKLVKQAALVIDRLGFVLACNAEADRLFDDDIRIVNRRLIVRDREARHAFNVLLDQLRVTPDTASLPATPIIVRRDGRATVLIRILPISGAARSPFLGARALLTFTELGAKPGPHPRLLSSLFGLTAAEARLASAISAGASPEVAANRFGIARETARNQLKAVFAKTETHRQSELVVLLSQLSAASVD